MPFTHEPYRASAPVIQDVIVDQAGMVFDTLVLAAPQLAFGAIRPIAVTSAQRLPFMLDVLAITEFGVDGLCDFKVILWQGVFAPKGTPESVMAERHDEIIQILVNEIMLKRLNTCCMNHMLVSRARFREFQKGKSKMDWCGQSRWCES